MSAWQENHVAYMSPGCLPLCVSVRSERPSSRDELPLYERSAGLHDDMYSLYAQRLSCQVSSQESLISQDSRIHYFNYSGIFRG